MLHFIDHSNGELLIYNGGTGVVPNFRGHQLTSKMYEFILPKLIEHKVDRMLLEVLTENIPAIKTYQKQGFKITNELSCLKGKIKEITENNIAPHYEIVALKELYWKTLQAFWDHPPAWQNSNSTMNNLKNQNLCLGVVKNDQIFGYIIYNPQNKRINQMAVDKDFRNIGLGSHLLNSINTIEKEEISIINIDSRSKPFINFFKKRGFTNYTNQFEMELKFQ